MLSPSLATEGGSAIFELMVNMLQFLMRFGSSATLG